MSVSRLVPYLLIKAKWTRLGGPIPSEPLEKHWPAPAKRVTRCVQKIITAPLTNTHTHLMNSYDSCLSGDFHNSQSGEFDMTLDFKDFVSFKNDYPNNYLT